MKNHENEPNRIFGYGSPERADRFESAAARAWGRRMEGANHVDLAIIRESTGQIEPNKPYNIQAEVDDIMSRINVPQNLIDTMNS